MSPDRWPDMADNFACTSVVGYAAELRSGQSDHTFGAGLRYRW